VYRVMIIDDETALRSLLRKTIDWEGRDLKVVGEAASGIEAINTIDEYRPDIVFVDIRMPFMDGIEFSKLAIKRYPRLKILILTAFDDFSYAKECIGIGVSEYLLKPIVRADIYEALDKVIGQLDEGRKPETEAGPESVGGELPVRMTHIREYVEANYNNPELNLTSISTHFGFNASYFSRKFKDEAGKSFIDFLTELRVRQACKCAKQGHLMYVTAGLVGIPDPNYFGKCFKKYMGVSYSDFAKQAEGYKNGTNIPS